MLGSLTRRLGHWRPEPWRSAGTARVLVLAVHPDDEIGCAGTLLLHRRAGDAVEVAYVTDGRGSRAGGLSPDQMAERRRTEAVNASALLDAGFHWLGLREWEWAESDLVPRLRTLLRELRPQIVYAPSCIDFHPEHLRTARALATALDAGSPAVIRAFPMQVPLTPVLVSHVASVEAVEAELRRAMQCYASQLGNIERALRAKRYAARLYGRGVLAEEFWQVSAEAYRRIHSSVAVQDGRFRGLRARPFSDPAAYLTGLARRRELRRMAAE